MYESLLKLLRIWDKIWEAKKISNNNFFGKIFKISGITIEIVDGDKVKIEKSMDFVEGGNDEVYDFIPPKTIWIDGRINIRDIKFIALHEFVERILMDKRGLSYNKAHEIANTMEKEYRTVSTIKCLSSERKKFNVFCSGNELTSIKDIKLHLFKSLPKVQEVYDQWDQDESGIDIELGSGGICQDIAEVISSVLNSNGIESSTIENTMGEQHVYVIVKVKEGVFGIDINPRYYENGSGYSWKKIPDVIFNESMFEVYKISENPEYFDDMISYY